MKSERNRKEITPDDSFKKNLRTAFDKVADDVKGQSDGPLIKSESLNDFFIGLLFVRIIEETPHWQNAVGTIGKMWAQYRKGPSNPSFHDLVRKFAKMFKRNSALAVAAKDNVSHLTLLMRFVDAGREMERGSRPCH